MFDLISIGDVTEDVFVEVDDAAKLKCNSHSHRCFLEFPFGTKLGIKHIFKLLGGNAGNVAIGSKRLGLNSALYSEAGKDTQGELILASLKKEKVSIQYFKRKPNQKTNYSVVLYFHGERTILVHHEPRTYNFPLLEKSSWIYLTSMAQGSQKIFKPLLTYLKKSKAQLAFNPGTYQLSLGLKALLPLFKQTTVLFLNVEEAQTLLKSPERHLEKLLIKLHISGPKVVVITDGGNGSYCFDGKAFWYCPIYKVPALERTGCGDAYATGFIAALKYQRNLAQAMVWGSINSTSVLQRIGPQAGLIRKQLLEKITKASPNYKARFFQGKEVIKDRVYYPKKYKHF